MQKVRGGFVIILRISIYLNIMITVVLLVALLTKGGVGRKDGTAVGSAFESSGSTSRYALTEALVEDGTIFFNEKRARFSSPDVSEYDGNYFSLFNPGVSIMGMPFYAIGKRLGDPQLGTYFLSILLAVGNAFLVMKLAQRFGAGRWASLLSGLLFLYGTNMLSYSLTFTQHPASTFFILLATLSALGRRSILNNIAFGALYGAGLLVDMPNGIIMMPLVFYVFTKLVGVEKKANVKRVSLKLNFTGLLIGLIPFIMIIGWYNYSLTGSYMNLPQFVGRSDAFSVKSSDAVKKPKEDVEIGLPFNSRNQLTGFYVFLVSSERSVVFYEPIVLVGLIGLYLAYRKDSLRGELVTIMALMLVNFITYTMFSDPTGSWAFGPRYLIPGIAVLSAGIGIGLEKYKRNIMFILIFLMLSVYSVGVNVMGAMTTTQVPPKIEAVNLTDPIPYTYEYNWQLITEEGLNSSLFYNTYLSESFTPLDFALFYTFIIFGLITLIYIFLLFEERKIIKS